MFGSDDQDVGSIPVSSVLGLRQKNDLAGLCAGLLAEGDEAPVHFRNGRQMPRCGGDGYRAGWDRAVVEVIKQSGQSPLLRVGRRD
jgi:hypothetical protein